jgi:uncharacterized membrane protein YhaH (DUF805 family)
MCCGAGALLGRDILDWKYLFLSFEGRIGRQSFWMGVLALFVVNVLATIVDSVLGGTGIIGLIVSLALIYPSVALSAKRWHDRDKSAWWMLIALVPVIGWIWAIVENGFLVGTAGANRFGPDPLAGAAAAGTVRKSGRNRGGDMLSNDHAFESDPGGGGGD